MNRIYSEFNNNGEALSPQETLLFCRKMTAQKGIILIGGMPQSGKSTIIEAIYQQLTMAANSILNDYSLVDSITIDALKFRCKQRQEEKEYRTAEIIYNVIERPNEEYLYINGYVHMHIRSHQVDCQNKHLLMADLPGEYFDRSLQSKDIGELRLTNIMPHHYVLIIDGSKFISTHRSDVDLEQVLNKEAWYVMQVQSTFEQSMKIFKTTIDVGCLSEKTKVEIVITKWDCVSGLKKQAELLAKIYNEIKIQQDKIQKEYGRRFDIRFFQISARPDNDMTTKPYGLEQLFNCWVTDDVEYTSHPKNKFFVDFFNNNSNKCKIVNLNNRDYVDQEQCLFLVRPDRLYNKSKSKNTPQANILMYLNAEKNNSY
ncbi:MAG: hypothetical protein OMM_02677 [Candidatus Magnetoglobus multicellularis str. Araruama]|uniref:Double-GTPase 2 domain-containing protein n=1 Tax=Candidatus Magnetoglobus multicellularis str. Araruama TaxID=890399 RepID=A0A1V1P8R7_9BACT|nr:MAG: hypothetical protein OMM_02677 [Candidatus Magnetoglobus multicellularis str. Araruama]